MRRASAGALLILSMIAMIAACVGRGPTGAPTQTTSSPAPPGSGTPASPATAWTTSGGPATPGNPSTGAIVDPAIEPVHDGGVW